MSSRRLPSMEHKPRESITIYMVREGLGRVGPPAPPAPYEITWYQVGDERDWVRIHVESYGGTQQITPRTYVEQFGVDPIELARRQCYLRGPDGKAVATATAWLNDDFPGKRYGRVHWVAVAPEAQGKGLGRTVVLAALCRMRELGYDGAYLTTESYRARAVNLYLSVGFRPYLRAVEDERSWKALLERIGVPDAMGRALRAKE